jgi:hypothetical protein
MEIKNLIVQSLEREIAEIRATEQRQIATVKERVMREKIVPFNQEIDQARAKAEAELAQSLQKNIAMLQEQYALEKKALYDAGEKKKSDNLASVLATETYAISAECQNAIGKLTKQVNDLKE